MRLQRVFSVALLVVAICATGGALLAASGLWGTFEGFPIVRVMVEGEEIQGDVPAINFNGRTMVPIRFVAEALGANVGWDDATQTASINASPLQTLYSRKD